jgi:hypothetical protein
MKKHKPVKHAHRKSMIANKKAKGKYSKVHLPEPKTIADSCGDDEIGFFFMHICKHCFARGKSACKNCVVWK